MGIKAVWKNEERFGCEFLMLESKENNIIVKSTIIYEEDQSNFYKVNYTIELDVNWVTKKVNIKIDDSSSIEIISDGKGNWFNSDGDPVDSLKGSIDIDISVTPFTNSLPINRFDWDNNQQELLDMVFISVPSLEIKRVSQSYQYLGSEGALRYFNYRSNGYETTVCVDEKGLVVSYPEVFSRSL